MAKYGVLGISFDHMHMGDLLRQVHEHPDAEIAGIFDPDPGRMETAAANFGIPRERIFTDLDECLARTRADLAIVCSATAEHANSVEKIAPHGLHVMIEKPFAANVADARRMEPGSFAAHGDVGSFRKNRIEMGCDHHQRAVAGPAPQAHDVPDLVLLDIFQTMRTQHLEIGGGAALFLERRRRNFGQRDDVRNGSFVLGIERRHRHGESRVANDRGDVGSVVARHGMSFSIA